MTNKTFRSGPRDTTGIAYLAAVHAARQSDIGDEEVDPLAGLQRRDALRAPNGNVIAVASTGGTCDRGSSAPAFEHRL